MDVIKLLEEVEFVMRDYGFDEEEEKLRAVINKIEEKEIFTNDELICIKQGMEELQNSDPMYYDDISPEAKTIINKCDIKIKGSDK